MTQNELIISRISVADEIRTLLRRKIMTGDLPPGQLLRQDQLASQLGASRTPLREALQRLAQEGLVQISRRGATVVAVSREDLEELYEIREALETLAVRQVASEITDEQLAELDEILDRHHHSDGEEWVTINREFHNRIYAHTHKHQLIDVIGTMSTRADVYVRLVGARARRASADAEHNAIVRSLRDHDPEAAALAVAKHLRSTVLAALEEMPPKEVEEGDVNAHRNG